MSQEIQRELLNYCRSIQVEESAAQKGLRQETAKHPYQSMQILPEQARLLAWIVTAFEIKTIIELGVFTGYSALVMAEALPSDGNLYACDHHPEWPKVGKPYWEEAGVANKIHWHQEDALAFLRSWSPKNHVDLIFIDSDKRQYDAFYESSLNLLRPGGLMVIDNVFLMGRVVTDPEHKKTRQAMRVFNQKLAQDQRVDLVVLPIADGMTLLRKR